MQDIIQVLSNNIGKTFGVDDMEKTFVMIKPDAVKRQLVGEIIQRLERKGLVMAEARMLAIPEAMAEKHYSEHKGQPYFSSLISFITSGPVLAMVWQGPNAVSLVRNLLGHRDPLQAVAGTIRGDYAFTSTENLVHAADSPQSAAREITLFFGNSHAG